MKTLEEVLWKNTKDNGSILEIGNDDISKMQVTCGGLMSCCGGSGGNPGGPSPVTWQPHSGNIYCG